VWQRLAGDLKPSCLEKITKTVDFQDLAPVFDEFIAGRVKGRTVVRIGG
jgi:alcohol dehydrogenase